MAAQDVLIRTLVELADNLVDDFDVVDMLTTLSARCVEAFGVSDAGIVLASPRDGQLRAVASSSLAMRELELYELQAEEGPCYDCFNTGERVVNQRLDENLVRWPLFAPLAIGRGFRSVSALPLRLRRNVIGGLNLFQSGEQPIPDDDLAAVQAFADMATITILQHRATADATALNAQLTEALESRVLIEQAKGIFAERAGIEVDDAFQRLRHRARSTNVRLSDLARRVVQGEVDPGEFDWPPSP
jgi:GAF domain-containing protein